MFTVDVKQQCNNNNNLEHFMLVCSALAEMLRPMLERFLGLAVRLGQNPNDYPTLIRLILDCSKLIDLMRTNDNWSRVRALERRQLAYDIPSALSGARNSHIYPTTKGDRSTHTPDLKI